MDNDATQGSEPTPEMQPHLPTWATQYRSRSLLLGQIIREAPHCTDAGQVLEAVKRVEAIFTAYLQHDREKWLAAAEAEARCERLRSQEQKLREWERQLDERGKQLGMAEVVENRLLQLRQVEAELAHKEADLRERQRILDERERRIEELEAAEARQQRLLDDQRREIQEREARIPEFATLKKRLETVMAAEAEVRAKQEKLQQEAAAREDAFNKSAEAQRREAAAQARHAAECLRQAERLHQEMRSWDLAAQASRQVDKEREEARNTRLQHLLNQAREEIQCLLAFVTGDVAYSTGPASEPGDAEPQRQRHGLIPTLGLVLAAISELTDAYAYVDYLDSWEAGPPIHDFDDDDDGPELDREEMELEEEEERRAEEELREELDGWLDYADDVLLGDD